MRRIGLGILVLLGLFSAYNPVGAEDDSFSRAKLNRAEISQFLGKWEGTLEQRKGREMVTRTLRMDVTRADEGGYRAIVFRGSIKSNVGLLRTSPPSEKEYKVKFGKMDNVPCMKIKMGHMSDYVFFRRGENLFGKNTSTDEQRCLLSRPK